MGKVVYFESGIIVEFEKEYSNRKHVRETVRLEQSWHKERFGRAPRVRYARPWKRDEVNPRWRW